MYAPIPRPVAPPQDMIKISVSAVVYAVAALWPFVWAWYEYVTLNDSSTKSDICNESGCVGLGSVFAHSILAWLPFMSGGSVAAVWALGRLRRALRGRTPSGAPVNRLLLAALFFGVCALAFLFGALRGYSIAHSGS